MLADALALADEESTRTDDRHGDADRRGPCRHSVPRFAPFFANSEELAAAIQSAGDRLAVPSADAVVERPMTPSSPPEGSPTSTTVTSDGFAGLPPSRRPLFLKRFVGARPSLGAFDIYGWCPTGRPH